MTTNADIIRRTYRLMGVLAAGDEPTGADAADAMERLQSLILGLPGLLLRGRWCDVATSAAYTAKESERVTVTLPGAVTLPLTMSDCAVGSRPPRDLARVQIIGATDPNVGLWVYVASVGAWKKLTDLEIAGDFPFGAEDVEGIAAQLAVDLSPEFGDSATINQRTVDRAQISAKSFRARFLRTQPYDPSRPDDLIGREHWPRNDYWPA
jgi:hypothetical protein